MKKSACFAFCLVLFCKSLFATEDLQRQAIESLGQLNGVALQCRQITEVQRMKQAMVETLPKQRLLGEWYDAATNDAFLAFAREQRACPQPREFRSQVDAAIERLKQAFTNR